MRRVILRNGQCPGDVLTMTRAVADLKLSYPDWEIDVRTPCPEIWQNSPHLTPLEEGAPGVEAFNVGYGLTDKESPTGKATGIHTSGWQGQHFTDAFREDLERVLGVPITKTGIRPELWVSAEEKSWYNQVHCEFGWDGPFWLINAGRKQDNELKQYHRWRGVAEEFNRRFKGKVRLVQIGHKDHVHPKLDGVWNLIGKTDLRQLIRLGYWAQGTIGPLSFQFVMSAAFEQPHVVVAGGKEGVRWQIYPHGRYLYTNGALECCKWDGCWLGGDKGQCKNLVLGRFPKCFDLITPPMIVDAVEMYYKGGRLHLPTAAEAKVFQLAESMT